MPIPLYSRLVGSVTVGSGILKSITHDEIGVVVEIEGSGLIEIKYDVETQIVPQLSAEISALAPPDRALITPTVAMHTLPTKVVDWINLMNSSHLSEAKRALGAQDFIRNNYQYDGGFLDREDVRAKRSRLSILSGNHHIELLHASGDDEVLGRGVCYELNVLLVELLRHLKIPSLIATGWVLDEGVVDLSDHLFALALLKSEDGPCLLPLDAAATDRGPIRTVHRRSFPTPPKDLTAGRSIPTVKGSWNISPKEPRRATADGAEPEFDYSEPRSMNKSSKRKVIGAKAPGEKVPEGKAPSVRFPDVAPGKSENHISRFLESFSDRKKSSAEDPEQKTVSKSLSDARIAQERSARKQLEDALEKERLMRQRAETRLGEERRLRKIAEERVAVSSSSDPSSADNIEVQESLEQNQKNIDFRVAEPRRQAEEFKLLCKAYDLTIDALGLESNAYPMGSEGLRQKLIKLLGSTAALDTFLRVLRGEQTEADTLTPELKFLEDLRLIELETVPTVRIHVVDSASEDDLS